MGSGKGKNKRVKSSAVNKRERYVFFDRIHYASSKEGYVNDDSPTLISYHKNGRVHIKKWGKNGDLWRGGDKPSEILYGSDGTITLEVIVLNNSKDFEKQERIVITYNRDGNIREECKYLGDKLHSIDHPAKKIFDSNGNVMSELWFKDDKLHRDDSPASIGYNKNGVAISKEWFKDGKLHREDGPAAQILNLDGSLEAESWYYNDKLHREDGPAVIKYDDNQDIIEESYRLHDVGFDKSTWAKLVADKIGTTNKNGEGSDDLEEWLRSNN